MTCVHNAKRVCWCGGDLEYGKIDYSWHERCVRCGRIVMVWIINSINLGLIKEEK